MILPVSEARVARTEAAVIARILAGRARPVKVSLADAANVVFGNIPLPCSDGIPFLDGDFHCYVL